MAEVSLPPRSPSMSIVLAIGFAVAAFVLFGDYYEVAMEHMSEGHFGTEQVFGLVGAVLLVAASIGALVALPERLRIENDGLLSVRGVFGTLRKLRPKSTITSLTIHTRQVRSNNLYATVHDVWIDGEGGRKRLCRFPPPDRAKADALVAHCAELWGAKVEPWS